MDQMTELVVRALQALMPIQEALDDPKTQRRELPGGEVGFLISGVTMRKVLREFGEPVHAILELLESSGAQDGKPHPAQSTDGVGRFDLIEM